MASKEKPKSIDIKEVKRTRRFIRIHYKQGDEDFRIRSNDNPLPAFNLSLDALNPLVCSIVEVAPNWNTNLKVTGISVGEMRDVKTVSVNVQKSLTLSGKVLELSTPAALLSTPKTEGAITEPLTAEQAELVAEVIEQAKRYVKGDRAQGTLDLEGDDDDDDDSTPDATPPKGEELPFPAGSTGKPTKKKRGVVGK
jgi:hypothetical protein